MDGIGRNRYKLAYMISGNMAITDMVIVAECPLCKHNLELETDNLTYTSYKCTNTDCSYYVKYNLPSA